LNIIILTLFPEIFDNFLKQSIFGRAVKTDKVSVNIVNFREYSKDKHKKVDDAPYGGGSGMLIKPESIFDAVEDVKKKLKGSVRVILLTPQGRCFKQGVAKELTSYDNLIFICGHYEGFDERIREFLVDDEISIGDYILTGGEIPAMVVVETVVRLLPDVLGNESSHDVESFCEGLLEYPQYTRPEDFKGMKVPEVLLSGHHKEIANWRKQQAEKRTKKRRPDLKK
jgi:tRNA (guanine37-N1)-methyltransferase